MGKARSSAGSSASAATAAASAPPPAVQPGAASAGRGLLLAGVVAAVLLAVAVSQSPWLPARSTASHSSVTPTLASLPAPPHWGTYRPNLYLGVRGTWGASPLFGWAWSCATEGQAGCSAQDQIQLLRHDAEERDGVSKYGWLQHNGDDYGVQGIVDRKMRVNFTTSFVQPRGEDGAARKDRWAVRIEAQPVGATEEEDASAANGPPQTISLFFYTALADAAHSVELASAHSSGEDAGVADPAVVQRLFAGSEAGQLTVRSGLASDGQRTAVKTYFHAAHIDESPPPKAQQGQPPPPPQQFTWAAKDNVQRMLRDSYAPRWQRYVSRMQAAHRQHQKRHRYPPTNGGTRPEFVPTPDEHFVPTLGNKVEKQANFLVVQHVLTLPFTMDFVLQPTVEDELLHGEGKSCSSASMGCTTEWFHGHSLSQALQDRASEFDERFARTFPLGVPTVPAPTATTTSGSKGLALPTPDSSPETLRAQKELAQALLSNLLGGVGFFHGKAMIEESPERKDPRTGQVIPARVKEESTPSSLLSCVPSRSFFPRGFMWDEGFHQLLVSRWSLPLSLSILDTWFAQIRLTSSPAGWLPREQILGDEARRRVPEPFRAQKPTVANPPTMLLALERMLQRLLRREASEKAQGIVSEQARTELRLFTRFLVRWLPTLHTHVSWFFRTQASTASGLRAEQIGSIDLATGSFPSAPSASLPWSFRWAGRTLDHCLASGLDDYPRASWMPVLGKDKAKSDAAAASSSASPSDPDALPSVDELLSQHVGVEGHVDLHAWMILLADTMGGLMEYAGKHVHEIDADEVHHAHPPASDSSPAAASNPPAPAPAPAPVNYPAVAASYRSYSRRLLHSLLSLHWSPSAGSFSDFAYRNHSRVLQSHKGYVSLMPLLLGILPPESPQLLRVLQALRSDKWALASPGGMRSLSGKDKQFGSGEDYWRGHVWVNMQFLGADALASYARNPRAPDPVRQLAGELAGELRATVSSNVLKEYRRTGFVWEQYNAMDGTGRKSHPFTGWTALTLMLMTDQ